MESGYQTSAHVYPGKFDRFMRESMMAERDFESDTDSNGEEPGPSKKAKLTKMKGATVYRTKFNPAWMQMYPYIREVSGNAYNFHCTLG